MNDGVQKMNIEDVKPVKKSAINSKINKVVAGLFGLIGIYMLIINLVVYGNLIPLWIIVLSIVSMSFLPLAKVEDKKGNHYFSYWGIVFR